MITSPSMEMGESRKALPHERDGRYAFCELPEALKGENCMLSDFRFEGFPQVRLVRQACEFGMGAFAGNGENLFVGCGFQDGSHTHIAPGCTSRSSSKLGDCVEACSVNAPASTLALSFTASITTSQHLPFQVGNGESNRSEDAYEVDNRINGGAPSSEASGFASPRISFSRDFAMVDIGIGAPTNTLNNSIQRSSPRLSAEKRKWEQQDCYSSDFQFSSNEPTSKGISPTKGGLMISADELFCDGKLLPLPYPSRRMSYDDLCLPSTSEHYGGQQAVCTAPSLHASLRPPSDTCATVPTVPIASFFSSSPSSKYALRFKDMFKLKKVSTDGSPDSELARDSSVTSTCRIPISPRSFWPFSRNGTLSLACSKSPDQAASTSSKGSDGSEDASTTNRPGHMTAPEMEIPHTESIIKSHSQVNKLAFNTGSMRNVRERIAPPLRDYRSPPSEAFKNRASATLRSFARGSPGRRGGNANKVLLKNLERCSAEKKLGRVGLKGGTREALVRLPPVECHLSSM